MKPTFPITQVDIEFWCHKHIGPYIPQYPRLTEIITRYGNRLSNQQFTDADPFKIIWVSPSNITHYVIPNARVFGRVYGGSWDKEISEFNTRERVKSINRHFCDGVAWEDTDYYQTEMELLQTRGKTRYNCTTPTEVDQHFTSVDQLYETIYSDGYLSQQELLLFNPHKTRAANNDEPSTLMNEIGVNIGRSGELLFSRCGIHRLTIAKLLDCDRVPVNIRVRHRKWQQLRNEIIHSPSRSPISHPDLSDLTSSPP